MTLITTTINGKKKYLNVRDTIGRKVIVTYEDDLHEAEDFYTPHNATAHLHLINNPHNHLLTVEEIDINHE